MKKLMTSLLAVMLCGIGFLWADGATVKGTVQCVWEGTPSSAGLTGTVTLYQNNAVTSYSATLNGGAYEITGVPEGNYTAKFAGTMRGQSCAGDNTANVGSGAAMHGGEIECNIMAALSSSPGTDPTPSTVTMKVSVGYNVDEYNTGVITFKSIKGATVTCKQGETTIATATTASDWQNEGIASLNGITVGETYSISVHADGFKDTTLNNVTGVATATNREALKIGMREALVTVSGTLKLGETALTELPEGMTLMIGANGTGNTAQINESGYTVECKPGNMKVGIVDQIGDDYSPDFQKSLTANYTVTTPENASFTVPDNAETFTQDIVLTKAYAAVIGVDASDKLNDNELTLTKQGETEAAYTAKFLYGTNKFRFNGVEAGTYTLGLNKFGYKLKGEAPTVTVAADLADVTLSAPVEIEEIEEATATWTGTVRYNAADGYTPVYVEGATVTLYARDLQNGQKTGEPLATATSAADGSYSISITGKRNAPYILEITHASILPFEGTVNATGAQISAPTPYYGDFYALWASGQVVYDGDIASGSIKFLKDSYNVSSTKILFDATNKNYAIGKISVPNGSGYTISFEGKDADKFVLTAKEENVDFSNGAVTQNLTAAKDADKGYMTIRLRYRSTTGEILAINNASFYLDDKYKSADSYGNAEILVEKGTTHTFSYDKSEFYGYDAVTIEGINAFREIQGEMLPNDTTIYIPGLEPVLIKLSGTVTMPEGVGEDVQIGLRTVRDLEVMSTPIVKDGNVYKYTFNDVPVAAGGSMHLFLIETDAKYDATYKVSVPYNYALPANTYVSVRSDMPAEATKDLTVSKIACNVSGTVTPVKSGQVTLTKDGAYYNDAEIINGNYKFQGVAAGTYTLTVNCAGYEPKSVEVTVSDELEDVTVDAISLEAAELTVTVSGMIGATNPKNNKFEPFDGAELSIWNSDGTIKLAERTQPKEKFGWIENFSFQSLAGTKVLFKMTHPSIEPVSKEYTVSGATLAISASDLKYKFVEAPDNRMLPTDFKAAWNANFDSLKLSWSWPEGSDNISKITLSRKLTTESGNGASLKTWEATGERTDTIYSFAAAELPVAYTDTVKTPTSYTYLFEIMYADRSRKQTSFIADMRDGERYTLAYTVNNDKMGTIMSYGQPAGEYLAGDQITVTAEAKPGYKFVEFLKNDQKLTEAERAKLILYGVDKDSVAIYGFSMPASDVTVKAVFASKDPNVKVEYTVTLKSNNEAWGTVEGAGTFEEGTEIEVKAVVTDAEKYEFVAWKEGDKEVSKEATYKFKVEKDVTLTAEFREKTANENLKAAQWAIFAEDGAIVIKGINGDRYDIYDLNGRLCGAALCTGAELRLSVAKSKLYIVRRLGADGSFDAKKIVVR